MVSSNMSHCIYYIYIYFEYQHLIHSNKFVTKIGLIYWTKHTWNSIWHSWYIFIWHFFYIIFFMSCIKINFYSYLYLEETLIPLYLWWIYCTENRWKCFQKLNVSQASFNRYSDKDSCWCLCRNTVTGIDQFSKEYYLVN